MRHTIPLALALILPLSPAALAQGSAADFARSRELARLSSGKIRGEITQPQWIDATTLVYLKPADAPAQPAVFMRLDATTGTVAPLFEQNTLDAFLTQALALKAGQSPRIERVEAQPGRIDLLVMSDKALAASSTDGGKSWREVPLAEASSFLLDDTRNAPRGGRSGRRGRRGDDAGGSTGLILVNTTKDAAKLFWINGEARTQYGEVAPGETRRQHTFAGHRWEVTDAAGKVLRSVVGEPEVGVVLIGEQPAQKPRVEPEPKAEPKPEPKPEPKAEQKAPASSVKVDNRNLVILDEAGKEVYRTADGTNEAGYSGRVHASPDGRWALAMWHTPEQEHKIHMVESSPADQVQPRLKTIDYLKPGDRISQEWPRLVDLAARRVVTLETALFSNPWSIDEVHWSKDSSTAYFIYNQRGHEVVRLCAVDVASGKVREVTREQHGAFIDYVNSVRIDYLDETREAIWMSERDGWRHLYLLDLDTGNVKSQITRGEWVVRSIERVDVEKREIWFWAGGIRPEQDPYYLHLAKVNFDGSGLVVITEGDGTHEAEFSPDRRYIIDRFSRVDLPPVTQVRRTSDGSLVAELGRADWSELLSVPWVPPERFVAKGRDGTTDIYGIIVRPSNFDPSKKYPVIEQIYAGPHSAFVPKSFSTHLGVQDMAELGFILVQIDGMGTAHRSRQFHEVSWKNLADAGLPDRIAWMKAAAAKYPQMDLSRVGIYGGSAGGQNALAAVLTHGEFYKAASADCGCHDNRMDKIWWNELWMSWPIGEHYAKNSNVTLAPNLTGDLLLIVGELDSNVDPASTMQVVNALIKADKRFDLLVVPGAGHGAAGHPYARKRQQEFFLRSLYDWKPPR